MEGAAIRSPVAQLRSSPSRKVPKLHSTQEPCSRKGVSRVKFHNETLLTMQLLNHRTGDRIKVFFVACKFQLLKFAHASLLLGSHDGLVGILFHLYVFCHLNPDAPSIRKCVIDHEGSRNPGSVLQAFLLSAASSLAGALLVDLRSDIDVKIS